MLFHGFITVPFIFLTGGKALFLMNDNDPRIIPEHVTSTSTSRPAAASSNESLQNCVTLTGPDNVGLQRNSRQHRSQGFITF